MKRSQLFLLILLLAGFLSTLQAAVPASPSLLKVSGRNLLLQRRLANGSLSAPIVFTVNGVNWSPTPIGATNAPDWANYYAIDLNLISQMNATVVRIYEPLPMNATGLAVLDYCYQHNIYMIMNVGYYYGTSAANDASVAAAVNFFKNHPAMLMFEVGNEWPYNFGYNSFGNSIASSAPVVQRLAGVVKANDPVHPVTSSLGNAYDSTPQSQGVFNICSNVDVWGFNTYLVGDATAAVTKAAGYSTKPYYFSEIGTDAFNNQTHVEDQPNQSKYTQLTWNSVKNASQFTTQGGPISGEVFFEFSDEWYKAGSPSTHDNGGAPLDLYDGYGNEEWWGFVDIYRNPRQVYMDMKSVWQGLNTLTSTPQPYGGALPVLATTGSTRLQAENFDLGGQGVAFNLQDKSSAGVYRADGFDIQVTTDTGGGYNLGWTRPGNWAGYSVSVSTAGSYTITARVASGASGGTFHLEAGPIGQVGGAGTSNLGTFTIPGTGGWQNWTTLSLSGVQLSAGTQWIRLVEDTAGWNINYLTFTLGSAAPTVHPYSGIVSTIANLGTTTLQVEDFDLGGPGKAFLLSNPANVGVYRPDGFDLEAANDVGGGQDLGWTAAGNWTGYTVNVATAGTYIVSARVASLSSGGSFHLEAGPVGQVGGSGTSTIATFTVPQTGGWQNWTTIVQTGVKLAAGTQWLRLVQDTAGWNANYLTFTISSSDTGSTGTGSTGTGSTGTGSTGTGSTGTGSTGTGSTGTGSTGTGSTGTGSTGTGSTGTGSTGTGSTGTGSTGTGSTGTGSTGTGSTGTGSTGTGSTGTGSTGTGSTVMLTDLSPTLYLQPGATTTSMSALTVDPGTGGKMDTLAGTSDAAPLAFEARGITSAFTPSWVESSFQLYLTSNGVGNGVAFARLKFDFDGDGVWDRTETWSAGGISRENKLEIYSNQTSGALSISGSSYHDMVHGRVRFEIWYDKTLSPIYLRTGAASAESCLSVVTIPYVVKKTEFATREPIQRRAAYTEGVLTSGRGDDSFGQGANAFGLSPADVQTRLTAGLAVYRDPNMRNGSCASCHSPGGYDLAKIGFSDATILRRASFHVDPPQASQLVEYIHALRMKYNITRPLNPTTFRPMQPQFESLPGDTTVARDTAFADYLVNQVKLLVATDYIDSETKAVAAEAQLKNIDLAQMKVGVKFDRWSEDKFDGLSHVDSSSVGGENGSVAEWLPDMVSRPKSGHEAEYYALFDQYAANPTDANFYRYYDAIEDLTESDTALTTPGLQLGYNWMKVKFKATQLATHMMRRDTIDVPKRTVDLPSDDLATYRDIAISRDPIWNVGDLVRISPFYDQLGQQRMTFPPNVESTIDPRPEARLEQAQILQTAWFWAGWQADPALMTSGESFATTSGDYMYPLNMIYYKVHYAFILAKLSVEKAHATAFTNNLGDGVDGHGMWASIRPFLVYKHSDSGRARPGLNDPRYVTHSRIIGNSAAMWILMVDRDLRLNKRVYDAYGTVAAVEFARTLITEMLPEHNWNEVDAALARIQMTLNSNSVPDVRLSFSTNRGLYHEIYQALGIPDAAYQVAH